MYFPYNDFIDPTFKKILLRVLHCHLEDAIIDISSNPDPDPTNLFSHILILRTDDNKYRFSVKCSDKFTNPVTDPFYTFTFYFHNNHDTDKKICLGMDKNIDESYYKDVIQEMFYKAISEYLTVIDDTYIE